MGAAGRERRVRVAQVHRGVGQGPEDREVVALEHGAGGLAGQHRAKRVVVRRREPVHAQRATLDGQISRNAQKLHDR